MTDDDPTRRLPLYQTQARPCSSCGRLVVWDGRNGYRAVVPPDAVPWPTGSRWCRGRRWWGWFALNGHDPDPEPIREGRLFLAGLALGAVLLGVLVGLMIIF